MIFVCIFTKHTTRQVSSVIKYQIPCLLLLRTHNSYIHKKNSRQEKNLSTTYFSLNRYRVLLDCLDVWELRKITLRYLCICLCYNTLSSMSSYGFCFSLHLRHYSAPNCHQNFFCFTSLYHIDCLRLLVVLSKNFPILDLCY